MLSTVIPVGGGGASPWLPVPPYVTCDIYNGTLLSGYKVCKTLSRQPGQPGRGHLQLRHVVGLHSAHRPDGAHQERHHQAHLRHPRLGHSSFARRSSRHPQELSSRSTRRPSRTSGDKRSDRRELQLEHQQRYDGGLRPAATNGSVADATFSNTPDGWVEVSSSSTTRTTGSTTTRPALRCSLSMAALPSR